MTQLAMVGAEMGIPVHIIYNDNSPQLFEGNHLLVKYLGAIVHYEKNKGGISNSNRKKRLENELILSGGKPFVIDYPISNYTAYFGYMRCLLEVIDQMKDFCFNENNILQIFLCSGWHSYLGMRMAADLLNLHIKITAFRQSHWVGGGLDSVFPSFKDFIREKVSEFSDFIDFDVPTKDFDLREDAIGLSKETVNSNTLDSMKLLASTEGIILDPYYNAKAFTGMLSCIKNKSIEKHCDILFIHSGGLPNFFGFKNHTDYLFNNNH